MHCPFSADASGALTHTNIRILYAALKSAAAAYRQAKWQGERATISLQSAIATAPHPGRSMVIDALGAIRLAHSSAATALRTVENLLAVWLAHGMLDETLRFGVADVAQLEAQDDLRAVFADSSFCAAILRQLKLVAAGEIGF